MSLPFLPPEPGGDPTTAISIPPTEKPHSPGRQAGRAGRRLQDLPTASPHQQPQRYLLTITTTMMAQIAPSMIIIYGNIDKKWAIGLGERGQESGLEMWEENSGQCKNPNITQYTCRPLGAGPTLILLNRQQTPGPQLKCLRNIGPSTACSFSLSSCCLKALNGTPREVQTLDH